MERLTKREGKHTIRIGNKSRRHDVGWNKLVEYEDLKEQGLLIRVSDSIPITIGKVVFRVNKACEHPIPMDVVEIKIRLFAKPYFRCKEHVYGGELNYNLDDIGKTVFLTRKEATLKLKETKGE